MESFLLQATVFLLAAVAIVPISARLGFGSALGYITAGIAIDVFAGLASGGHGSQLHNLAEFGVVMMLFVIGLGLEPRAFWGMRHQVVGLGTLQITVTAAIVMAAAMLLGLDWKVSLAAGLILALSSTAIVLQTLTEKGLMGTGGGRAAFSVLLMQDVSVIPILAALPLLAAWPNYERTLSGPLEQGHDAAQAAQGAQGAQGAQSEAHHAGEGGGAEALHEAAASYIASLPGWGATLVTIAAVAAVMVAGLYLTRPVFRHISLSRQREVYTAFAILIVAGSALVTEIVGVSPALGAFLAGVVLANSEFRHELTASLRPFKELLLGLFFMTIGAGINFGVLFGEFFVIIGLTVALVAGKGLVLFALGWAFALRGRDLRLFTLSLAQAGEFGFLLIAFSTQQRVMPGSMGEILLIVIALSMLVTPLLFIAHERLPGNLRETAEEEAKAPDAIDAAGPVIIAGIGRFGQVVDRLVRSSGFETVALDNNYAAIHRIREFGVRAYFGDPRRADLLFEAGLWNAAVLVVAVDDPKACEKIVRVARQARPNLRIVARARDRAHVFALHKAGADDIVREVFDSSLRAGRYALEATGMSEFEAANLEKTFYHHDRDAVAELASLWKPGERMRDTPEYMKRARELDRELETMLLTQLETAAARQAQGDGESDDEDEDTEGAGAGSR